MGWTDELQDAKRAKARKKTPAERAAGRGKAEWKGFVNLEVTAQWREMYEAWESDEDLVAGAILDVVEGVGKLSLSYDARQGCYLAALTVTDVGRPDAGWCVTARSKDLWKAMRRVVFLYWQVAAGDLSVAAGNRPTAYTDEMW